MSQHRAIILCTVADQPAAKAIADACNELGLGVGEPFGPGSTRWSTDPAATIGNPTHLCVSGMQPDEFVERMRTSSVPFFMVIDNYDDANPRPILAALNPPLYLCIDTQEV